MVDVSGLSVPFAKSMVQKLNKGGVALDYIPVAEVIARLNQVLGAEQWGYKIIDRWTTGEHEEGTPKWCMVHVEMTIGSPTVLAIRSAIGGQPVKMLRDGTGPVDLGDEWKGAVSDALKKAAQAFGVGLELARKDEALAEQQRAGQWPELGYIDEQHYEDVWTTLRQQAAALDDDAKALVKNWWNERHPTPPHARDFLAEYAELLDRLTPADANTAADPDLLSTDTKSSAAKGSSSSRQKRPPQGVQTSEPEPDPK